MKPDLDYIKSVVNYDPEKGVFTWKKNLRGGAVKNRECLKVLSGDGYYKGSFKNVHIKAHAVAWAMYYGEWHSGQMDHINKNKLDNRIENLRLVTPRQNCWNRPSNIGSSIYRGVYWYKRDSKWKVSICGIDGKKIHLGTYTEETDAAKAYDCVARILHGEYATTNFR